jgi:hypothetical protein
MKNPDQAIQKVLAELRDCESTVGLEGRILRAVQDHAAKRSAPGCRSFMPTWRADRSPLAALIAWTCAVSLLCLAGVFVSNHVRVQTPARLAKTLPQVNSGILQSAKFHLDGRSAQLRVKPAALRTNLHHRKSAFGHFTQLASHPAPPLPLTRQEQLLLQIAHRIDPKQLAMLNPTQQALQNAKEKREFQEFFGSTIMRGDE